MPDPPTPGEVAYTAYYHTRLRRQHRSVILTWTELTTNEQAAWEAAAQDEQAAWEAAAQDEQAAWEAAAQAVEAQEEKTKMQWSHMTNAQALALKDLLRDLGVPVERQFWRQSPTHDNDHTCYVAYPTGREIEAIAQLMKTHRAEDTPHA